MRRYFVVLLLIFLFVAGMAARRHVLTAQYRIYGRALPFTLESAMSFRLMRMVSMQGGLPVFDPAVQYPEGVNVFETYSIGMEYFWSWLADCMPKSMAFSERVRWVSQAWFCMGILFLFALIYNLWGSLTGAGFGAACYAISLASVIRSTGQELSDENFALPIVLASFAAALWAHRQSTFSQFLFRSILASLLLAWALTGWDLIQVVVMFIVILGMTAYVRNRLSGRAWIHWLFCIASLVFVGRLNPYLRAHCFLISYVMLPAYGVTAARLVELIFVRLHTQSSCHNASAARGFAEFFLTNGHGAFFRAMIRGASVLGICAAFVWLTSGFGETYNHFFELLWAKLVFFNKKPANPALLTFNQAILWTPALNSATFQLTRALFPATIFINALALVWILFVCRRQAIPFLQTLLAASIISWSAYFLFARFHVFVAFLSAIMFGFLAWRVVCLRPSLRWLLAVFVYALIIEGNHVFSAPERWGRRDYYRQKQELVDWFKTNTASEPVLANFGLSGTLLAYADCPIVLHPKFENKKIRQLVEGYGRALFLGDELLFRNWAESHGARYYVHSMGEFSEINPELQMRYFVNAVEPSSVAAARLMEFAPNDSRFFVPLYQNLKYRVYGIITSHDERQAVDLLATASIFKQQGNIGMAETMATLAMQYDPLNQRVQRFLLGLSENCASSTTNHP